eukprot:2404097-Amphidinium_carterae.1
MIHLNRTPAESGSAWTNCVMGEVTVDMHWPHDRKTKTVTSRCENPGLGQTAEPPNFKNVSQRNKFRSLPWFIGGMVLWGSFCFSAILKEPAHTHNLYYNRQPGGTP